MFFYPRAKESQRLMDNASPASFATFHKSGWINKETFILWFKKFLEFSNPSQEKPVLLLLDGHKIHTKSLELINLARERNFVILTFPPNTTHRLQPGTSPLWLPEQEVRKWLFTHPGMCDTTYNISTLFNAAFTRAAVMVTAINGFQKILSSAFKANVKQNVNTSHCGQVPKLRMFTHAIDLAVTNSWLECRRDANKLYILHSKRMDPIYFRFHVAEALILSGRTAKMKRGRRPSVEITPHPKRNHAIRPVEDIRYDGIYHLPSFDEKPNASWCKHPGCKQKKCFLQQMQI